MGRAQRRGPVDKVGLHGTLDLSPPESPALHTLSQWNQTHRPYHDGKEFKHPTYAPSPDSALSGGCVAKLCTCKYSTYEMQSTYRK